MRRVGRSVIAFGSCLYPADLLNERIGYQVLTRLSEAFEDAELLGLQKFFLIAGDSIYADATGGLFDPELISERYRSAYQRLRQVPAWAGLNQVQKIHSIDDHEIDEKLGAF